MNNENITLQKPFDYKIIAYIALLGVICVCAFMFAKYLVQRNIDKKDVPIDTSTRM